MRALIFDGVSARLDSAHTLAVPARGEAVIRLVRAAISRTDLEVCRGLMGFRGVLGQQFVGVVEEIPNPGGPGLEAPLDGRASAKLIGKRVVGSIITACGACDMCIAGLGGHCRSRTIMGLAGRDGCLAERFTLPLRNLTLVPNSVDDDHAVFALELAAAIQAASQLTIAGRPYITVLGDGSLGLLMSQVMGRLNASVRVVGAHPDKLAICEKWGIRHRHVDEIGRRADQDIVVDCTGSPGGFELAMELVRPRGKIVLKSLYAPLAPPANTSRMDFTPIILKEIEVIGSYCGPMSEAIAMLARREIDVVSLISKRLNLRDGAAVINAASQPEAIKVLVDA